MLILFCMRGCGRIERPAFPAPSNVRGRDNQSKTRAKTRGEIAKLLLFENCIPTVIARLDLPFAGTTISLSSKLPLQL
jgi:hypothetical protein